MLFPDPSTRSKIDTASYQQFTLAMGEFLKREVDIHLETAMYASVQKVAYNDFLKGRRKKLPDIYEGGGEKVLLDSYLHIKQGTILLHALEQLKIGQESKNKYRVLLSKSINDMSQKILALVEIQEGRDAVRKKVRERVRKKLGLDYRE